MITTILVYSLFITNPAGTLGAYTPSRTPYFFAEETQMREYETYEQCDEEAKKVRADLSSKLNDLYKAANSAEKQADFRIKQAKFESLKCLSVKRQIDTTYSNTVDGSKPFTVMPDKKAEPVTDGDTVIAFRIGRISTGNKFHGTEYNKMAYSTKQKCDEAYRKTQSNVVTKATIDGADSDGLVEVLNKFSSTYQCVQVQVKSDEKLDIMPAAVAPPAKRQEAPPMQAAAPTPLPQAPVQQNVVVQPAQPVVVQPQQYPDQQAQMEMMPAPQPAQTYVQNQPYYSGKRYTLSELIVYPNGYATRVYYGSYPSVLLCNQALQQQLQRDEQGIYFRYLSNQSMAGYEHYRAQLFELQRRRSNLSCVA